MCGIVGYIGDKNSINILIDGLEKLEYRGYDSAGVAVLNNNEIKVEKNKGRIKELKEKLKSNNIEGKIGIGHTRWATHGEPSDANAHPHLNSKCDIAVVHNGIIENYLEIKEELIDKGYSFCSDTDTEVIPCLIDFYYNGDIVEAVKEAVKRLEGAYALAIMSKNDPDKLVAVRKDSPLIIGLGEGENFIASDIPAILNYTRNVYLLENGEMAVLTKDTIELMKTDGTPIKKDVYRIDWDIKAAEKGGYDHFMLKEIYEQPKAIKDTLSPRLSKDNNIKLDDINISGKYLDNLNRIYIVACGTAYHAGMFGKMMIEKYVKIPTIVDIASEFRYSSPLLDENTLMIVVSQSGETADTLAALRLAKEKGARVLAVTNVVGSSVSREADDVLYTWAGPEIAVASTKAYTTQLVALAVVAMYFAKKRGTIEDKEYNMILDEMRNLSSKADNVLNSVEDIKKIVDDIYMVDDVFYMGRGLDNSLAMEGSLKLKEISYLHSEAIAAGELKHGTLALIEKGTPVIALALQDRLYDKMLSNIKEVKARGAHVIAFAKEKNKEVEKSADEVVYIPDTLDELAPILCVIHLQLLAYYVALKRGNDVDKPRNLAKSVTVE